MNARALGRFVADFMDGFAGSGENTAAEPKPETPIVVPVDMVRAAVADFLAPMVEQAQAEEEPAPSAEQLSMMFSDAAPRDDLAEAALRRVHDIQERQAERDLAARNGAAVPETFDPNAPDGKPWMGARLDGATIERNTG